MTANKSKFQCTGVPKHLKPLPQLYFIGTPAKFRRRPQASPGVPNTGDRFQTLNKISKITNQDNYLIKRFFGKDRECQKNKMNGVKTMIYSDIGGHKPFLQPFALHQASRCT